ncbi:MAG: ATP synthase F0 subunit C [Candidatus Babeliaceae bacterium]
MDEMIGYAKAASAIAAAIIVGIGVLGPAFAQGLIGSKACENIGKYPESASKIRTAMLLAMALVETLMLGVVGTAFFIIWLGMR